METKEQNTALTQVKKSAVHEIIDWIKFLVILLVVCLVTNNVIGFTKVSGHSMDPSLRDGSILFVNKLSTHINGPKHGDVVIVHTNASDIVKRVVALPGETIAIMQGVVYVNEIPLPEINTLGTSNDMEEIRVTEDHIFVLGDNRTPGESLDSRSPVLGLVSMEQVKGYAMVSVFPFYKIMKPLKM